MQGASTQGPLLHGGSPRPQQSPERRPRAFVCSAVVPSQGGRAQLRGRLIVCRSGDLQLWAELPALAPGARCQGDVPLGPGHLRRCSGRRRCDTPGTSEIRRECWSRGRIVSALLLAAQGGCLPSMEPPNPVAATMDLAAGSGKVPRTIDTGLHRRQRAFMKGASWPPHHSRSTSSNSTARRTTSWMRSATSRARSCATVPSRPSHT